MSAESRIEVNWHLDNLIGLPRMSEQKYAGNPSPLPILPAKRRRGRPRKDENVGERVISSQSPKVMESAEVNAKGCDVEDMMGRVVSGVIDGCFDAGYFLTVRIGSSSTLLRGVVFQPGRFLPITAATDVVPEAKMLQRRDIPVPVLDLPGQNNGIIPQSVNQPVQVQPSVQTNNQLNQPPSSVMVPQSGSGSMNLYQKLQLQSAPPPLENLRMVEQDEVMQVFEISTQPKWPSKVNAAEVSQTHSQALVSTEPCFVSYDCVRLPQNPVASESQAVESKMEENKSSTNPNHDQQIAVYVPQAHSAMDSGSLVQAEDKSISQEPQLECELQTQSLYQHQDHNDNPQALQEFNCTMENPTALGTSEGNPGRFETQIFNSACGATDIRFVLHGDPSNTPGTEHS